jgi:putative transposase
MKYRFISEHAPEEHSVGLMCRVLKVSRSGYYASRKRPVSKRAKANARLLEEIKTIYQESRSTYGSPRVHRALRRKGLSCGRHRVARLMAKETIVAKTRRRYRVTTRASVSALPAPDRLKRVFDAREAHTIWTGDITYIATDEGWLYLAIVLDLYSRAVVGWATSERIDAELVCSALERARYRYRPCGEIIMHSDRGSQYTSHLFRKMLGEAEPVPLLQSNGFSCFDNAVTESFFHTLKTELVYFEHYRSRLDAHQSVFDYIESFYNNQRLHSSIGYVTPMEKLTGIINKAA